MSRMHFSNWLAFLGVVGGVAIALALPAVVVVWGQALSPTQQVLVIVLALLVGGAVAGISAVVGITIPTVVQDGRLNLDRSCCPPCEPVSSGAASGTEG